MKKLYNNKIISIFIIMQPIIDIITSIMLNNKGTSFSFGMIARFIFLFYACFYLIKNRDKKITTYLIILFSYMIINLLGNFIIKDNFIIVNQLILLLKMIYFPIVLLFFYKYFKNNEEVDSRVFTYTAFIVGASLVISLLTKTTYCTYDNHINCLNDGVLAYFNSANEYGLILIALLGLTLKDFIKKLSIFNIVSLLLMILFLAIIGTKTGYVGLIGILAIYILYYLITYFIVKERVKNIYKVCMLIITTFLILNVSSILPISNNLNGIYERTIEQYNDVECENCCADILGDKLNGDSNNFFFSNSSEVRNNMVFNGRNSFMIINKNFYKNANIFNKLFGITTQGNYIDGMEYTHITERDFHDLLIFYGIIGLLIELLLPLSLIVSLVKKVLKNIKVIFDEEFIIYGLIISFILLGSFMAGHCLFSPAVSFYLALMISLLIKKVGEES